MKVFKRFEEKRRKWPYPDLEMLDKTPELSQEYYAFSSLTFYYPLDSAGETGGAEKEKVEEVESGGGAGGSKDGVLVFTVEEVGSEANSTATMTSPVPEADKNPSPGEGAVTGASVTKHADINEDAAEPMEQLSEEEGPRYTAEEKGKGKMVMEDTGAMEGVAMGGNVENVGGIDEETRRMLQEKFDLEYAISLSKKLNPYVAVLEPGWENSEDMDVDIEEDMDIYIEENMGTGEVKVQAWLEEDPPPYSEVEHLKESQSEWMDAPMELVSDNPWPKEPGDDGKTQVQVDSVDPRLDINLDMIAPANATLAQLMALDLNEGCGKECEGDCDTVPEVPDITQQWYLENNNLVICKDFGKRVEDFETPYGMELRVMQAEEGIVGGRFRFQMKGALSPHSYEGGMLLRKQKDSTSLKDSISLGQHIAGQALLAPSCQSPQPKTIGSVCGDLPIMPRAGKCDPRKTMYSVATMGTELPIPPVASSRLAWGYLDSEGIWVQNGFKAWRPLVFEEKIDRATEPPPRKEFPRLILGDEYYKFAKKRDLLMQRGCQCVWQTRRLDRGTVNWPDRLPRVVWRMPGRREWVCWRCRVGDLLDEREVEEYRSLAEGERVRWEDDTDVPDGWRAGDGEEMVDAETEVCGLAEVEEGTEVGVPAEVKEGVEEVAEVDELEEGEVGEDGPAKVTLVDGKQDILQMGVKSGVQGTATHKQAVMKAYEDLKYGMVKRPAKRVKVLPLRVPVDYYRYRGLTTVVNRPSLLTRAIMQQRRALENHSDIAESKGGILVSIC